MCACYLGQGLDKGVLGTASIMGLQADTGMVGQDYALAVSLSFLSHLTNPSPLQPHRAQMYNARQADRDTRQPRSGSDSSRPSSQQTAWSKSCHWVNSCLDRLLRGV